LRRASIARRNTETLSRAKENGKAGSKQVGVAEFEVAVPSLVPVTELSIANAMVTGDSFPTAARLRILRRLSLRFVSILRDGEEVAARIARESISLERLLVKGSLPFPWDAFFDALPPSPSIRELRCATKVPVELLVGSVLCTQLTVLRLSFCELTSQLLKLVVAALEPNQSLVELNVSCNDLDNEAIVILQPLYNRLRRLDLSENTFTDDAALLTPLLTSGGPLVRLRFADNVRVRAATLEVLGDRLPLIGMRELRVSHMVLNGLSAHTLRAMVGHLVRLDMSSARLGDQGAVDLASGLESAGSLEWLVLSANTISGPGLRALQEPLAANATIRHLNLSFNLFAWCGEVIGAILANNFTLRKLSLKGCKFTVQDWKEIAAGLARNRGLREVVLYANNARDNIAGCYGPFAYALASNPRLEVLKMQREDEPTFFVDPAAIEVMLAVVEENYAIQDIQGCSESERLQAILQRNRAAKRRVQRACLLMLTARKFDTSLLTALPKQIVAMIAQRLYETRGEHVWVTPPPAAAASLK
jgi:Ran GTPase-activating protein (RanGAP) involved in mRNA processing and transport